MVRKTFRFARAAPPATSGGRRGPSRARKGALAPQTRTSSFRVCTKMRGKTCVKVRRHSGGGRKSVPGALNRPMPPFPLPPGRRPPPCLREGGPARAEPRGHGYPRIFEVLRFSSRPRGGRRGTVPPERKPPPGLAQRFRFKVLVSPRDYFTCGNDPSAGSPTETLLRLLLPLSDQVRSSSRRTDSAVARRVGTNPRSSLNRSIGSSDGRCVQRAGT